jgi:hypothetical protein
MPLAVLFLTGLDTYAQTASESNQDNANIAWASTTALTSAYTLWNEEDTEVFITTFVLCFTTWL